jgi:hypothetical protein
VVPSPHDRLRQQLHPRVLVLHYVRIHYTTMDTGTGYDLSVEWHDPIQPGLLVRHTPTFAASAGRYGKLGIFQTLLSSRLRDSWGEEEKKERKKKG